MSTQIRCLCGPRHFVADATPRRMVSDPTGTLPLQRKFASELDRRWAQLGKMIPAAVARYSEATQSIAHSALTGENPVKGFQGWFDEALRAVVFGVNGSWTLNFVRQATNHGALYARKSAAGVSSPSAPADRTLILQAFAITELQGIMEAVSQQAVRVFAQGQLADTPATTIINTIRTVIGKTGKERGHLLVGFIAVRAFNAAAIDGFRAIGITSVGIDPERLPRIRVTDANEDLRGLVNVLTAGDDDVCPICQDLADAGPYSLDEAEGLLPAHPRCRCAVTPAHDERYADDPEDTE